MHAWGLRLRRVLRALALPRPPVLPSALLNCVGTLVAIISQLDTQPACAPVNASRPTLRLATHDSGSGWLATPFLYGSYIHDSMPVYPGAPNNLLIGSHRSRFFVTAGEALQSSVFGQLSHLATFHRKALSPGNTASFPVSRISAKNQVPKRARTRSEIRASESTSESYQFPPWLEQSTLANLAGRVRSSRRQ